MTTREVKPKFINTRRLQIFELNVFMILEHGAIFDGVGFLDTAGNQRYTFQQAVDLFNNRGEECVQDFICNQVKLRYEKRNKKIVCYEHLIRFTQGFREEADANKVMPVDLMKQTVSVLQMQ